MKIGLAYGKIQRFNLGLPEYGYEDVLVGTTLDRMSEAEHHANPGEIIVDEETLHWIARQVEILEKRDDFWVIGRPCKFSSPAPWPSFNAEISSTSQQEIHSELFAAYVPAQVMEALQSGWTHIAELKPVVSIFVQFHGLNYSRDAAVREKLQTYFTAAQEIAARHGGRLNRLITGDKGSLLHIIFGAPLVVEKQEARAVLCALDIRKECGALPFIHMQRIGIAAGRAFAGPVGSPERHDYTTMGDAINLSARLMQNAAPDQILIDAQVHSQLGEDFELADMGLIQVKGKSQPVAAYAALGLRDLQNRAGSSPAFHQNEAMPIFGRQPILQQMADILANLAAGQGKLIWLDGQTGTGKTHLLEALRHKTRFTWLSGAGLAYGQTLNSFMILEVLRDLLNIPAGSGIEKSARQLRHICLQTLGVKRLSSSYPYLAHFLGLPLDPETSRRLEGLTGESLRWQVFELIIEILQSLLAKTPIIIALDDLQWADSTSLHFIEQLGPLVARYPLGLILSMQTRPQSRAWEVCQALQKTLPASTWRITLDNLDHPDAKNLLAYFAPTLSPSAASFLIEKSGGNPLFLVEMIRAVLAQVAEGEPALQPKQIADLSQIDLAAISLPDSVQGLILAQIDRLRIEARRTLQLASVIGRIFFYLILDMLAAQEQKLAEQLDFLEQSDYVRHTGTSELGQTYAFRHSLIQESVYSTLLFERRQIYHCQIAESLVELFPYRIDEQAGLIAYHYEHANRPDEAFHYYQQAADRARILYALEEGRTFYRAALRLLDGKGIAESPAQSQRARILFKLAQLYIQEFDFENAQDLYEQAFELFEQTTKDDHRTVSIERRFRAAVMEHGPYSLDPGLTEWEDVSEIINDIFEGLLEMDTGMNLLPAAARRWQVSPDGKTYRFWLRAGLRWSDGTPLTSHDFVSAWQRNLHPATGANLAHQLYLVKGAQAFHQGQNSDAQSLGITAIDGETLEIILERPAVYFPYILARPITYPQPAHLIQAHPEDWATPEKLVCNGAFRIRHWHAGQEIELERNPYYRGFASGNLDIVSLQFISPSLENYSHQRIDWCRVEDRTEFPDFQAEDKLLIQYLGLFFAAFACARPPFNDPMIRRIFAMCIDRQRLVQEVWGGSQKPAHGGAVPEAIAGHSPEIGLPFDPQAAGRLLGRSRLAPILKSSKIRIGALPDAQGTLEFLHHSWEQYLGLQIETYPNLPADQLLTGLANPSSEESFQIAILGWALEYPDPDSILRILFHSTSNLNISGWADSEFDQIVEKAMHSTVQAERQKLYHQADRLLVNQQAVIIPLYYRRAYGLLRPNFRIANTDHLIRGQLFRYKNVVQEENKR